MSAANPKWIVVIGDVKKTEEAAEAIKALAKKKSGKIEIHDVMRGIGIISVSTDEAFAKEIRISLAKYVIAVEKSKPVRAQKPPGNKFGM